MTGVIVIFAVYVDILRRSEGIACDPARRKHEYACIPDGD